MVEFDHPAKVADSGQVEPEVADFDHLDPKVVKSDHLASEDDDDPEWVKLRPALPAC